MIGTSETLVLVSTRRSKLDCKHMAGRGSADLGRISDDRSTPLYHPGYVKNKSLDLGSLFVFCFGFPFRLKKFAGQIKRVLSAALGGS